MSIGTGANLDGIYTYDNEGKMATVAYPNSGPTFTNSFDNMSRPTGMTQGSSSIVSGVSYGPANELLGITSYGAVETRGYNNLLQMTSIAFTGTSSVNMQYSYPAGSNNGKIGSQTDVVSGEVVQYTYDSLNRLATAQTTSTAWGQGFVYDPFGNLTQINVTKGSAPSLSVVVDQTTNRLSGSGNTYDANGNANNGYTYDVENRMITAVGSADVVYAYSPSNQRVWKGTYTISGGNWTQTAQEVYFYGVDGKKLGTYQMAPNPPLGVAITPTELRAYFGSKPVGYAMGTNAQSAVFTPYALDRLGSNRGVGKFYPYGQDEGTPAPNDEVKFATYTRDSATGLDYAMNRYYSNSLGRFMSPDPYKGSAGPNSPQSWNRYGYTGGDPVNHNDPSGLCTQFGPGCLFGDDDDDDDDDGGGVGVGGFANGGGTGIGAGGGPVTMAEANLLYTLYQEGAITDWTVTPTGVEFSFLGGAATIGAIACAADPVCDAAAGVLIVGSAIYVGYQYLPGFIQSVENVFQRRASRDPSQVQSLPGQVAGTRDSKGDCIPPGPDQKGPPGGTFKWQQRSSAPKADPNATPHWHWTVWDFNVANCMWYYRGRGDGLTDPGSGCVLIPGIF